MNSVETQEKSEDKTKTTIKHYDESLVYRRTELKEVTGERELILATISSAYKLIQDGPSMSKHKIDIFGTFSENVRWFMSDEEYPFSFLWCAEMVNSISVNKIDVVKVRRAVKKLVFFHDRKNSKKKVAPKIVPILR